MPPPTSRGDWSCGEAALRGWDVGIRVAPRSGSAIASGPGMPPPPNPVGGHSFRSAPLSQSAVCHLGTTPPTPPTLELTGVVVDVTNKMAVGRLFPPEFSSNPPWEGFCQHTLTQI